MWKVDASKPGIATWSDKLGNWSVDARGGATGISLVADDLINEANGEAADEWLRLASVDEQDLPVLAEQFVRGDELHLFYAQGDGVFGIRLVIEPIRSTPENLILELTVSVQTTLLDTHPKLDVVATGGTVRALGVEDLVDAGGSPPVTVCEGGATVAVVLGQHDAPFTTNLCGDDKIQLRLFGDFLEKGVIRKARPWLVIDRGREIGDPQLRRIWRELSESPLPLTP